MVAATAIPNSKLQHGARVLAEWLDNDQDGCVDNPLVLTKLKSTKPKHSHIINVKDKSHGQLFDNLGLVFRAPQEGWETNPKCSGTMADCQIHDSTLEEVWHVVTGGYKLAWPKVFGCSSKTPSSLTKAMDKARGGKHLTIPTKYPAAAWYKYYDKTCRYDCQCVEYIWFAVATRANILAKRGADITREWPMNTWAKLKAKDKAVVKILSDTSTYRLPTKAPRGCYAGPKTCSKGTNLI